MKINEKAISILTEDEKAALSLQYSHNKSSWEAGEILNKSHYKYLEIKQRAEKFLKMFTNHFELYDGELVPDYISVSDEFRTYLEMVILKRKSVTYAIKYIGNNQYYTAKTRNKFIADQLENLSTSKKPNDRNIHSMIMEFDRYNNFRILPKELQEPSAFKRRNSTRYKKHLKLATTISPYTYHRIIERFQTDSKRIKNPGYMAMVNIKEDLGIKIIRINANPENLAMISRASLYVFKTEKICTEFCDLILDYISSGRKDPRKGLRFWPKFREYTSLAMNCDQVNNVTPSRRNLELTISEL